MKYGGDLFRLVSHVVVLIAVTAAAAALSATGRYAFALLLLPFGGIAVYRLVRLYDASMRRVTFLLDAVENNDLNFRFCEGAASGGERALNVALNRIREIIVRAKLRAEERERYYRLIMECARTGLLTVDDRGSVYQVND